MGTGLAYTGWLRLFWYLIVVIEGPRTDKKASASFQRLGSPIAWMEV